MNFFNNWVARLGIAAKPVDSDMLQSNVLKLGQKDSMVDSIKSFAHVEQHSGGLLFLFSSFKGCISCL